MWPFLRRLRVLERLRGERSYAPAPPAVAPGTRLESVDAFRDAARRLGPAHLEAVAVVPAGFPEAAAFVADALGLPVDEHLRRRTVRYLLGDVVLAELVRAEATGSAARSLRHLPVRCERDATGRWLVRLPITQPEATALDALARFRGETPERTLSGMLVAGVYGRLDAESASRMPLAHWLDAWRDAEVAVAGEVAVKCWLPELARQVLLAEEPQGQRSASRSIRLRLARFAWGDAVVAQLLRLEQPPEASDLRFSRDLASTELKRIYRVPELGKSVVAAKLFVSHRLRADLQAIAGRAGVSLSKMGREALVADLLGHATLPERPQWALAPSDACRAWEAGEPVPMREIPSAEIGRWPFIEINAD